MKNQKKIQTLAKVIYVFTIIGLIGAIIGLIGCLCVVLGISQHYESAIELVKDVEEIKPYLFSKDIAIKYFIVFSAECAFAVVMLSFVTKFYAFEVKLGDCFDMQVVKRMRKLAVAHIVIPIIEVVVITLLINIFKLDVEVSDYGGFITGIVYLIIARILAYGADLKAQSAEAQRLPQTSAVRSQDADARRYYYTDYNAKRR